MRITPIEGLELPFWAGQWFGVYATWETVDRPVRRRPCSRSARTGWPSTAGRAGARACARTRERARAERRPPRPGPPASRRRRTDRPRLGRRAPADTIRFVNALDTAAIQATIGEPLDFVVAKRLPVLDAHCRRFIELAPFLCLGTVGADGDCDVSPRGDPPGFVRIIDDRTLAIPERPGNRLADSLRNVAENGQVGHALRRPRASRRRCGSTGAAASPTTPSCSPR